MNVISKLKMDMTKPDFTLSINAVQGDAYSRSLCIALYTGLQPWTIPEGVTVAIRYQKPDRTKGYYDTLPDGTSAWRIQENMLTIQLAPQMLTVAGNVKTQIELIQGTHILSTFCLTVYVEPNPAAGVLESENYINWLQWIRDQSEEQVLLVQQSVQNACQASHSASLAAERSAAIRDQTAAIAEDISSIVAGNEAYTKRESDLRFSSAILSVLSGTMLAPNDCTSGPLQSLRIFGKTTQSSTPTPDAPVDLVSIGDSGSVTVTVCGKNLLRYPYLSASQTTNGITITVHDDGSIAIQGTATATIYFNLTKHNLGYGWWASNFQMAPYVFSGVPNGITMYYDPLKKLTYLTIPSGAEINTTMYLQIEVGNAATAWEPPTGSQELLVPTPYGLPGIPVAADGSYTDENGQSWISDEIDLNRGVYVQRLGRIRSYQGESVGSIFLSSAGVLTTGADVLYPLETPQETALPQEVMNEYRALFTRHPNTTLYNTESAHMQVTYTADTKLYIDNRIQSLLQ